MKLTKKTRVFITGAGGMAGEAIYRSLKDVVTLTVTSRTAGPPAIHSLDIKDHALVQKALQKTKPHLVIHLAALTDLERCEKHPREAWDINVHATERIAAFCRAQSIPMVYISTGIIFGGTKRSYTEFDVPHPVGVYAQTKYMGELVVATRVPQHFIFRAGWMMGGGPHIDKKFVNKILHQIQAGKKQLTAVTDKRGTITYTVDLAQHMIRVLEHGIPGIYHVACDDVCSRYDIAAEIVNILHRPDIIVTPVSSGRYEKKDQYFVRRPFSEALTSYQLKKMKLYTIRNWKVCLADYIQRWNTY